jgi:hypothetical protein
MQLVPESTSERQTFWQKLRAGLELKCPCCGRYSKVYRRQIHKTLVILMYKMDMSVKDEDGYTDMPKLLQSFRAGRDFCILKYWNLIEQKPLQNNKTRTSGFWRITDQGIKFLNGESPVAKYADVFDDTVISYSFDKLLVGGIVGTNFDYKTLMES